MGKSLSKEVNLITACDQLVSHVCRLKSAGKTIGVVPTMGALHAGHLSLVEASKAAVDETIVTIFVNPTQFAPGEDLEKYPRTLESDLEKLMGLGVETVFAPSNDEMYPKDFSTRVVPAAVAQTLEGESRPTHFGGVATIVLKLLNLTDADQAYFGQKDFQQVMVVKRMVADLNLAAKIVVCPIIREDDGLALSSRNVYLSGDERERAQALNKTLEHVRQQIDAGQRDGHELMAEMTQMLIDGGVSSIDYAVIADPSTLRPFDAIQLPAVALVAAHVGKTRLIDNVLIQEKND